MMLKIAICDDDINDLAHISNLIGKYQSEKNFQIRCDAFSNIVELLDSMHKHTYDILFLDILMPGLTGVQAAHEVRRFDNEVKIIFLSSSPEFAVESYTVGAYYYFIKPAAEEKLFPIIDKLVYNYEISDGALYIKLSSGIMRIPFNKLEFLEVMYKRLFFHLTDGSVKEIHGSLSDFETQLVSREEFIKVHRSYIVNMKYIQELSSKELIVYTKKRIPISRLLYDKIRQAYMDYLFQD